MANTTSTERFYTVHIYTRVDRPELRGATLPAVEAGRVICQTYSYRTACRALGELARIKAGEWDFDSEYVCRTWVTSTTLHATGERYRTVRRPLVRRERGESLAVESA